MPGFGSDSQVFVPGLYNLGAGVDQVMADSTSILSTIFNTRDLAQPGSSDFPILGPGSQAWVVGYSVLINAGVDPVNRLGLRLELYGSHQLVGPFIFIFQQRIFLPVYFAAGFFLYSGSARVEFPAVQFVLSNLTGVALNQVSFQFWGKAA